MQKIVMILAVLLLAAFAAIWISAGNAADVSSVPDKSYVHPENQLTPGNMMAPDRFPDDGSMKPECVIDSSLLDGKTPVPPRPDEVSVGSFQCQV